ncbi:MAG: hypothetical protein ACRDS9_03385, partial [Pseudonocardiaceae bacterium]
VPVRLATVGWYWQCDRGHRWRESIGSRTRKRRWQRFGYGVAACRFCVLDDFSPRYMGCGHQKRSLGEVTRSSHPSLPGRCGTCTDASPASGTAVHDDNALATSRKERELRALLAAVLPVAPAGEANAVVVEPTSWGARRVHPDILIPTYRIAVEYDSPGEFGEAHGIDSHDAEKDSALRAAGWEVIRVRTGGLPLLGPYDVAASGATHRAAAAVMEKVNSILAAR